MTEGNGAETYQPPVMAGLLRKRLRESTLVFKQPGLPDCELTLRCLNGDQIDLMLDEAISMCGGRIVPNRTAASRTAKYGVVAVKDLYDAEGNYVEVKMERYKILGEEYVCLPDEIVRMLPRMHVTLIAAEMDEISSASDEEKKDSNSTGGSENEGQPATEPPFASETAGSPVANAEAEA